MTMNFSWQPLVVLICIPAIWFLYFLCYPILWFLKVVESNNRESIIEKEHNSNQKKLESKTKSNLLPMKLQPLKDMDVNSNLCFILLALSSCPKFVKDIKALRLNHKTGLEKLSIFKELIIISNGETQERLSLSSNRIFQKWNQLCQQDIFEIIEHILNNVYNEMKKYKEDTKGISIGNFQEWMAVSMPMRIIYEYRIYCKCGNLIQGFLQSDLAIHLPISIENEKELENLQDLVDSSFLNNSITEYKCDRTSCNGKSIWKYKRLQKPLARTLCIHLQSMDSIRNQTGKKKAKIKFDRKLIIKSKFCISNGLEADLPRKLNQEEERLHHSNLSNVTKPEWNRNLVTSQNDLFTSSSQKHDDSGEFFELVSLLFHKKSLNRNRIGCYKRINQKWFSIEDYQLMEVDINTVLDCQAYLLFYDKILN